MLLDSPDRVTKLGNFAYLLVAIFVVKNIAKYFCNLSSTYLNESVVKSIRDTVFEKMSLRSIEFFNKNKAGHLVSLVMNDVNVMHGSIAPTFNSLIREPVQIILVLTVLLSLSPKLTLFAFSSSVVALALNRFIRKFVRRYAHRLNASVGNFNSILHESISGIRAVKGFSAEREAVGKFAIETRRYIRNVVKHQRVVDLVPGISEIAAISALSVVLYYGGLDVFSGKMEPNQLMAFLFALFSVMAPVQTVLSIPLQIQRGLVSAESVFRVIDGTSMVVDGSETRTGTMQELTVEGVSFAYVDGRNVLRDVSFTLRRGEKIAFVGGSGSGKSTLLDLVIRFYDPQSGTLKLNGKDIQSFTQESYRSLFGIVSQESILFNDTVANNISFGSRGVTLDDVISAAKLANAHDFISDLPEGYDTFVGDRGVLVSGGQRQRIAIARALCRKPEVLVFDEATSALDSESEKIVQRAIQEVLTGHTAIIVAHRLSTVIDCDEILVLEHGTIVERGTHQQLLTLNGVYRKLYDIQYLGKDSGESSQKVSVPNNTSV